MFALFPKCFWPIINRIIGKKKKKNKEKTKKVNKDDVLEVVT